MPISIREAETHHDLQFDYGGKTWNDKQGSLVGEQYFDIMELPTFFDVDFRNENEGYVVGLEGRVAKTTDGVDCPFARVYKPQEFIDLAEPCGFRCRFLGAGVSLFETSLLPRRFVL